jgi:wobble nucleotide-excising tRNase
MVPTTTVSMLHKIIKIRNVGRFENCAWRGGAQFESMSLIYGENGRGKSTFCDLLRSLQSGAPEPLLGRKRLGAVGDCEVELLTTGGKVTFAKGAWSKTQPEIAIFDTVFVHQNVFAGDRVDHEHKRNLYRVIVGEVGVKLAEKVDKLDGDIRNAAKVVDGKMALAQFCFPRGTELAKVTQMPPDPQIASKVAEKERELKNAETAIQRGAEIKSKATLGILTIPQMPVGLGKLLNKTIANVAEDAENALKEHLAQHTRGATQDWIARGVGFLKDETCPFCAQPTAKLDLIASYRAFFDKAYSEFKAEIEAMKKALSAQFGQKVESNLQKVLSENATLAEFWKQFELTDDLAPANPAAHLGAITDLAEAGAELLRIKGLAPTEPLQLSPSFTEAFTELERLVAAAALHNKAVTDLNERITKFKAQQAALDVSALRTELATLRLVEVKQTPEATAALQAWADAVAAKKALESAKETAKTDLDTHSSNVLKLHDKRINELLGMFGAGFRIGATERSYAGGKPSSTYSLVINRVPVELGDDKTPASTPSFRNTLSAGDRSTLALSFFIAQLERDPKLKDRILVFDDPFTSQDRSRRSATLSLINDLAKKAAQTIVLSHDPYFLRACWDGHKGGGTLSCFQFFRMGDGTTVGEWDVERETLPEYSKKHKILWDYAYGGKGSALEIAQTIRPVLEEYLRLKLPRSFADNEWLGEFMAKIRGAQPTDPLVAAQTILSRIELINEYSKRFHHSSTRAADTAVVDESELLTYVQQTLDLVGGF